MLQVGGQPDIVASDAALLAEIEDRSERWADATRCRKILRSVSSYVDAKLGKSGPSGPTFTLGWGAMQLALQVSPVQEVKNRFGVQAQINKLIFSQSAMQDLNKLLTLFGQRTTRNGLTIAEHFQSMV